MAVVTGEMDVTSSVELYSSISGICVWFADVPAQVNEAADGLIDELHYLQDQVNNVDPIAVIPAEIQDQISDNRVCVRCACSVCLFV